MPHSQAAREAGAKEEKAMISGPLQVGQRFRCDAFDLLVRLSGWWSLDHGWHQRYLGYGIQFSAGQVSAMIDTVAPDMRKQVFVVTSTEMSGGGTGMGPHDVFPDGWGVHAVAESDPSFEVFFRQSGCFCNIIPPEMLHEVHGYGDLDG
jgi:hypothetical protein